MPKINFYRLNTGLTTCKRTQDGSTPPTAMLFDVNQSEEYSKILEQRGKLGVTLSGQAIIPESRHTEDMLAEGFVAELEADGIFETPDCSPDSKEVVKSILRQIVFTAGIDGWLPLEEQHKKMVEFWEKILDRSSPRDVIEELADELKAKRSVKHRKSVLHERRDALKKEKEKEAKETKAK